MAKSKKKTVKSTYPTQIRIGSMVYSVHWSREEWDTRPDHPKANDDWGLTNHPKLGIWISPDLDEQNKRGTLLHEALHAIFAATGADVRNTINAAGEGFDVEEYTVSRIENPLLDFLVNNPSVVAFITNGELLPA
jgi:hypothetical protein